MIPVNIFVIIFHKNIADVTKSLKVGLTTISIGTYMFKISTNK